MDLTSFGVGVSEETQKQITNKPEEKSTYSEVDQYKGKLIVEQWRPAELKPWLAGMKQKDEPHEYIIVKYFYKPKEKKSYLTFVKKYLGSNKESDWVYEEGTDQLIELYLDRIRDSKKSFVEGVSEHYYYARNFKLCNQRIFFSPKARIWLERRNFDLAKFIRTWEEIEDVHASPEHSQLVQENLDAERKIKEIESKKLHDIEDAIAVLFNYSIGICFSGKEKKMPLHLSTMTPNDLLALKKKLEKEKEQLEEENKQIEERLNGFMEDVHMTKCYPINWDDYKDYDLDFSIKSN